MRTAEFGPKSQTRILLLAAALVTLSGCALLQPANSAGPQANPALGAEEVAALEEMLSATQTDVAALRKERSGDIGDLKRDIARIKRDVDGLPDQLSAFCAQTSTAPAANCADEDVRTVEVSGNKMVVGELEHIWLAPPGISLTGRIDTGTTSNLLRVDALRTFERDGDDWVRFSLKLAKQKDNDPLVIEREVSRYSRTSTRRPVVKLRVRLGDVRDSFEFMLVDRTDQEHAILLGRNFLKDIALVDVGRQFIQRRFRPKK